MIGQNRATMLAAIIPGITLTKIVPTLVIQ
jgi:hypothetical protein